MKSSDLLRLVDQMHHDKNVNREVIFDGIEAALQLAALKHFGEESGVVVTIDRESGEIRVVRDGEDIDPSELGRIPAQAAKNVMIQKIREAESNAVFDEYTVMKGDLVTGQIVRHESGAAIVSLGRTEALLPKSEQIPGETYHINDRVKAVILEVKKTGQRVKIVLSRAHPDLVRRLFENEIPEIQERIIEIKAVSREAGYRTKIAVSSIDLKVDCVGACVGVRGSRIKNIVDELGGERIDIVRWNDSLQVMIPNALQPAEIEEVFLYPRPGRAIVLVKEDQLSLAIGRRGQNVRLASKLVGWDIEIMTHEELNDSIEKAENWFRLVPNISDDLVEVFIEEGFMSFDDLSFCDPAELVELSGIPEEEAEEIIAFAEDAVERLEQGEDLGLAPAPEESDEEPAESATEEIVEEGEVAEEEEGAEEEVVEEEMAEEDVEEEVAEATEDEYEEFEESDEPIVATSENISDEIQAPEEYPENDETPEDDQTTETAELEAEGEEEKSDSIVEHHPVEKTPPVADETETIAEEKPSEEDEEESEAPQESLKD